MVSLGRKINFHHVSVHAIVLTMIWPSAPRAIAMRQRLFFFMIGSRWGVGFEHSPQPCGTPTQDPHLPRQAVKTV